MPNNSPARVECMDALNQLFRTGGCDIQRILNGYAALEHSYGRAVVLEALLAEHAIAVSRLSASAKSSTDIAG